MFRWCGTAVDANDIKLADQVVFFILLGPPTSFQNTNSKTMNEIGGKIPNHNYACKLVTVSWWGETKGEEKRCSPCLELREVSWVRLHIGPVCTWCAGRSSALVQASVQSQAMLNVKKYLFHVTRWIPFAFNCISIFKVITKHRPTTLRDPGCLRPNPLDRPMRWIYTHNPPTQTPLFFNNQRIGIL